MDAGSLAPGAALTPSHSAFPPGRGLSQVSESQRTGAPQLLQVRGVFSGLSSRCVPQPFPLKPAPAQVLLHECQSGREPRRGPWALPFRPSSSHECFDLRFTTSLNPGSPKPSHSVEWEGLANLELE